MTDRLFYIRNSIHVKSVENHEMQYYKTVLPGYVWIVAHFDVR